MNKPDDIEPQDGASAAGVPPTARLLLRIVYIMGIVLVLLFLTLVGGIIWKSARKAEPRPNAGPAVLSLGLPQDADIRSTSLDGDRLVITTAREVIIVDLRKNTILARISANP